MAAIVATLIFVLSVPPTSEIVFRFILRQDSLSAIEADAVATAAAKSAEVGEPWLSRFDPADLAARLRQIGFCEVVHLTPEQVYEGYLRHRRDGLTARHGEQLMRAVV
jgi:O-methyltransferase involved in polyketide biosynthesis